MGLLEKGGVRGERGQAVTALRPAKAYSHEAGVRCLHHPLARPPGPPGSGRPQLGQCIMFTTTRAKAGVLAGFGHVPDSWCMHARQALGMLQLQGL